MASLQSKLDRTVRITANALSPTTTWIINKVKSITLFPTFRSYSIKKHLFYDINAALILTAIIIPQCMAYAILAKMPPVIGIYISIIQPLLYSLFGSSPFVSFGTFALVSMLVGDAIDQICESPEKCEPNTRVSIGASLSLLVGICQIIMMLSNFAKVTQFLDKTVVRAFSTAIAFHIASSQLSNMGFITPPSLNHNFTQSPTFPLFGKIKHAAQNIAFFNWAQFSLFLSSLVLLLASKSLLSHIRKRFKHANIPMDFIIVFLAAFLNRVFDLSEKHSIQSVGKLPMDLPSFPPHFKFSLSLLMEAVVLALVSVSMHLSFIKVFNSDQSKSGSLGLASVISRRSNQNCADQEIIAAGFANLVSSCFSCYPGTASLSRSVVLFESEAKSQLCGVLCSVFMLVAFLSLRSLFQYIPMAVLAAVIVTALRNLFTQFKDIPSLYSCSKIELAVWLFTFISAFTLSCELGLLCGFFASVARHLYLQNRVSFTIIENTFSKASTTAGDLNHNIQTELNHCELTTQTTLTKDALIRDVFLSYLVLTINGPINAITIDEVFSKIVGCVKSSSYRSSQKRHKVTSESDRQSLITEDDINEEDNAVMNGSNNPTSCIFNRSGCQNSCSSQYFQLKASETSPSPVSSEGNTVLWKNSLEEQISVGSENEVGPYETKIILDLCHVLCFDQIGLNQFLDLLSMFPHNYLIIICNQVQIVETLNSSTVQRKQSLLQVVPNLTEALSLVANVTPSSQPDVINCSALV